MQYMHIAQSAFCTAPSCQLAEGGGCVASVPPESMNAKSRKVVQLACDGDGSITLIFEHSQRHVACSGGAAASLQHTT